MYLNIWGGFLHIHDKSIPKSYDLLLKNKQKKPPQLFAGLKYKSKLQVT